MKASHFHSDSKVEQTTERDESDVEEQEMSKKSKQLRYYYRKTSDGMKREYTPFADQGNPSEQLKS